jgi:CheY-like chemotaxis protein/uncharacterized protein YjbJ (UPF0337 family)
VGAGERRTDGRASDDSSGERLFAEGSRPIDSDVFAGKWKQMRGQATKWWSKSTGDDLGKVDGERDKLVGLLQERCGYARGPGSPTEFFGRCIGRWPGEVLMPRPEAFLDGVRVLVVDDHAAVRQVIAMLLEDFGARVIAVPGVPEALASLERECPNVVLSDIEMPAEDGYALTRKLRALPPDRGRQTPAAALTGLSTPADRARALQAGFQDHVAKPVDARQLVSIVTTLAAQG